MIPASEYVWPELTSERFRTRWNTQTANQAVGAGAVLTCAYMHGSGLIFRVLNFESIWHVADRAVQSARIGFGAL